MNTSTFFTAEEGLRPHFFHRYSRRLRGVLLDQQAWFVLRDLVKLTASHLSPRVVQKLDPDQSRWERLVGAEEDELLVSESGAYTLLMLHFYHPENRSLRQWITHEVIPALRGPTLPVQHPRRSLLRWENRDIALLEWNDQLWVRYSDVPQLLQPKPESAPRIGWRHPLRWLTGA